MKHYILICVLGLLLVASLAHAEDRYLRYRVLSPAVPTIATLGVHSHVLSETSWGQLEQPGVISNYGLYLAPATWSRWRKLPGPPTWGSFYINLKAVTPIKSAKVEFQLATYPSEKEVVRQFIETTDTGGTVGFVISPAGILDDPRGVETITETYARRRRIAESVAIPAYRRPQLLRFTGWGVNGIATIKGSDQYEYETTRMIGFNTFHTRGIGKYFDIGWAYSTEEDVEKLTLKPEEIKELAFVMLADEPGWQSGFNPMWERTRGNEGFRAYLKANNVSPALFGKASLEDVSHIRRDQEASVPATAPIEQRRLWYWSCRYTYELDADYYAGITKKLETKFPGAQSTVNYTDHSILLGQGVAVGNPDIYAWGRRRAVSMQWSEDWFAAGLTSWGNGMYQKLAFLVDLMRTAGRATQPAQPLGYHVVGNGYDPFTPFTDETVGMRLNLLIGRGAKTFSFFNYGPTTSSTVDLWADHAAVMRGTADALRMLGGPHVEPFLWEGMPGPTETCMFYSIPAAYWQSQNKTQNDNYEKQLLYCMLAQEHLPADVLDTTDLDRWIGPYKMAYLVDPNLPSAQAAKLLEWVKAGGVLALWPEGGTRDEFNDALNLFPAAPGKTQVGKGWIVRFDERLATLWWDRMMELNKGKTNRPVITDAVSRSKMAAPAFELAKVHRPVVANANGIDVRALYSERGVAVPVSNMQYLFPSEHQKVQKVNGKEVVINPTETHFADGCVRYTKAKPASVTLYDGKGVVQVYSSRLGILPFTRDGDTVTVSFPLETTDVLIFAKTKMPVEKYPWAPPPPPAPKPAGAKPATRK